MINDPSLPRLPAKIRIARGSTTLRKAARCHVRKILCDEI
jgi:hypothetical protein